MVQPSQPHLDLAALRAEYDRQLDALRAEIAALRRQRARRRPVARLLAIVTVALFVALVPLSILAATPFTDLTGGVHDPNIDLIYNAGITAGCVPKVSYCPTDNVTREQMASFLARTAGLGTNPPVANAKTALTATNATTDAKLGTNPGGTTYAANELVRTASVKGTNTYDPETQQLTVTATAPSTAFNAVATLTLTAPTAGFVIVNSTVGIGIEGVSTAGFARLRDTAAGGVSSPTLYIGTSATALSTTLSPTFVFPVTAGPRSFILEVQKQGAADVRAFDGVISAIFIPFGSTGTAQP